MINLNGKTHKWLDAGMFTNISPSPDGNFIMVNNIKKPFSYIVTYGRFPKTTNIYNYEGKIISILLTHHL